MRVAIYARVSTRDKGQDTENQLAQQRRYAAAQGWETVEYVDHETGKHSDRDAFRALFEAAARRQIDVVLVWALDRFSREGVAATFGHIERLHGYGVQFESLTEPHFRTTGPAGELMIAVSAWVAKQERIRISERTKAGMDRARAEGKQIGRPTVIMDIESARQDLAAGQALAAIARRHQVSARTLKRRLAT